MLIDNEFNLSDSLLLHKNTPPLDPIHIDELKRIQSLNVEKFNEADVRGEIIDPIIRILGYKKGHFSSVDRERHIRFLGKTNKYIDYSLTIWEENFWIIEAKRPLPGDSFGYEELRQATEYSIHPQINAAIIVLCDGHKLEIFDREQNVETPFLSFPISKLLENFEKVQKILDPMSIWYFYKRRVLRSIDKAFESEFNQQRVAEYQEIIERRLNSKTSKILDNFRKTEFRDRDHTLELRSAPIEDLVDIHFFYSHSRPEISAMNAALKDHFLKQPFLTINRIFTDEYRYRNNEFYMNALSFLIHLEKTTTSCNAFPSWIDPDRTSLVECAIKNLIKLCLTHFRHDIPRKTILLAASTYRRIFKLSSVVNPAHRKAANIQHMITRFHLDEFSWGQLLSSTNTSLLTSVDAMTMDACHKFVQEFTEDRSYTFKSNLARLKLIELWSTEASILKTIPNYKELLREIDFGDLLPAEYIATVYDNLGHCCLCILDNTKWESYVLDNHLEDLLHLKAMGSWAARDLLEEGKHVPIPRSAQLQEKADRFFFGNSQISEALYEGYKFDFRDDS